MHKSLYGFCSFKFITEITQSFFFGKFKCIKPITEVSKETLTKSILLTAVTYPDLNRQISTYFIHHSVIFMQIVQTNDVCFFLIYDGWKKLFPWVKVKDSFPYVKPYEGLPCEMQQLFS